MELLKKVSFSIFHTETKYHGMTYIFMGTIPTGYLNIILTALWTLHYCVIIRL